MQSETATSSGSGDKPAGLSWAWLTAVTLACTVSSLYYAIDRSLAFWRHGPPDPLGAMASPRIDYFWRIALAAFIASIVMTTLLHTCERQIRYSHMLSQLL
jgi:hypothetical protein